MDYQFLVSGTVVKGNQLGRSIGYPTINVLPDNPSLDEIPKGIYAVRALLHGRHYDGMANLGTRPTLGLQELLLEVNLFDFSGDIYGEKLTVYFFDFIREEKKFESLEELKDQIGQDKKMVMARLTGRFHPDSGTQ